MPYSVPEFAKSDTIATSASLAAGATSTTLTSGNFTRSGTQHYVVDYNNAKREVISATVSGTAMTNIVRGLDGTTDQDHAGNAPIISSLVPAAYQQVVDAVSGVSAANGWATMSGTQTYASGTTMNIPAGGLLVYEKGDKIKLNQSIPLTSYWALDSSSADTKGANNGTDTNVTYTAGKFGNAATFNGTTSKIVITDAANLKPTGAFTLGVWFKTAADGCIFQSYSDNTNANGISIQVVSGKLNTYCGSNAANAVTVTTGTTTVTDNAWHYAVWVFQSGFAKVFLDGALEGSGAMTAPTYAATNYVRVGCGNSAGSDGNFMNGQIDDLFLINGFAVDSAWVAAKYAAATAQSNANITATQYFYVTTVADTLLTLTGGADYVLYNGAITDAYYSKAMSPVGFPPDSNTFSPIGANYSEVSATQTGITATTDLAGGSVTVSVPAGTRLAITVNVHLMSATVPNRCVIGIAEGATVLRYFSVQSSTANKMSSFMGRHIFTPTAGAHTYKVHVGSADGGAVTSTSDVDYKAWIMVEKI